MNAANTHFTALEQISIMAKTLRTAARKTDKELLPSLVLALTPRMIELTDLLIYVALDDDDCFESLHSAVFGPGNKGSAA